MGDWHAAGPSPSGVEWASLLLLTLVAHDRPRARTGRTTLLVRTGPNEREARKGRPAELGPAGARIRVAWTDATTRPVWGFGLGRVRRGQGMLSLWQSTLLSRDHCFCGRAGYRVKRPASANVDASPGSFGLAVKSLVSNHQLVSRGFSDPDTSRFGSGTVTIEVGKGRVNRPTALDSLNGEEGVRRGFIRITDRSGESADVDRRTASTFQDVIDAINEAEGIRVRATVSGDALTLMDESEGTGPLLVSDLEGGHAAEDLGISGEAIDGRAKGGRVGCGVCVCGVSGGFEVRECGVVGACVAVASFVGVWWAVSDEAGVVLCCRAWGGVGGRSGGGRQALGVKSVTG